MIIYKNFKGDTYYLNQSTTKKGNPKYSYSKDIDKANISHTPKGYMAYENLNGQVFLIERKKQLITKQELSIVEAAIKNYSNVLYYRVCAKKNVITVGIGDKIDVNKEVDKDDFDKIEARKQYYLPMLRFNLYDKENREFEVERYCFRGSTDDWIFIDAGSDLKQLAGKYCPHLGRLSFYELPDMF